MHIAIAGNIGAGKTTLTTLLSQHFNMEPHYESVDENPYLEDFYHDMNRWSFHLQVYFLNSRFRQILEIKKEDKDIIQDRTIYEDRFIFASNLAAMGLMSERDFNNYSSLFDLMELIVTPPDLLIYLKATIPTLVRNIHSRGREYEKSINIDYLSNLNERYDKWIDSYSKGKLLVIEVDNLDFVNKPEDLGQIIEKVNAEIHGLFYVS